MKLYVMNNAIVDLKKWAMEENNRIKSSKIQRIAERMGSIAIEYRKKNPLPKGWCYSPTFLPPMPPVKQIKEML